MSSESNIEEPIKISRRDAIGMGIISLATLGGIGGVVFSSNKRPDYAYSTSMTQEDINNIFDEVFSGDSYYLGIESFDKSWRLGSTVFYNSEFLAIYKPAREDSAVSLSQTVIVPEWGSSSKDSGSSTLTVSGAINPEVRTEYGMVVQEALIKKEAILARAAVVGLDAFLKQRKLNFLVRRLEKQADSLSMNSSDLVALVEDALAYSQFRVAPLVAVFREAILLKDSIDRDVQGRPITITSEGSKLSHLSIGGKAFRDNGELAIGITNLENSIKDKTDLPDKYNMHQRYSSLPGWHAFSNQLIG